MAVNKAETAKLVAAALPPTPRLGSAARRRLTPPCLRRAAIAFRQTGAMAVPDALVLFLTLDWLARVAILAAIILRRPAVAAQGWLALVLVFPIPAILIAAWAFRPLATARRRARFAEARRQLKIARRQILMSQHCSPPQLPPHLVRAAQLVERVNLFPAVGGNRIEALAEYDEVVERLVADIASARHHVHLTTYIFSDDPVGKQIVEALVAAAGRGVECRVLIDALGSYWSSRRIIRKLRSCGVTVRRALSVSITDMEALRPDLRNHRKLAVIDGRLGFIGSQNIVSGEQPDGRASKEFMVRVSGPVVLQMQALFANDWFLESGVLLSDKALFPHERSEGAVHAQLVAGGPEYRRSVVRLLLDALIHSAERRLVVTTPYFVPDETLLLALEGAAARGVEVSLILPKRGDNRLVELAQHSFFDRLLDAGIEILLYRRGFLHAKHVSVDDELILVGSMNIDLRSLELNGEAGLLVYDRNATARLRHEEARNIAESERLVRAEWKARPALARAAENAARLFSPIL